MTQIHFKELNAQATVNVERSEMTLGHAVS